MAIQTTSQSPTSCWWFDKIGPQISEEICSYSSLIDIQAIALVSKYFRSIVASPALLKTKAEQAGIPLSNDQLPKDVNLAKINTIYKCVRKEVLLNQIKYNQLKIIALRNRMRVLPIAPPQIDLSSLDKIFKLYLTYLSVIFENEKLKTY